MKVTVYTIKDCAFSKQEKEYLTSHSLQYEEKNLETNKDFLTEMLAVSNNFAGTPVTRVEKDDGTISVLKGFTKEEFDTAFGFATPPPVADTAKPVKETPKVEETKTPIEAVVPAIEPAVPPIGVVSPVPVPVPVETPVITPPDLSAEASAKADPLKSVMDDLQSKSELTTPVNTPSIPDFPAK